MSACKAVYPTLFPFLFFLCSCAPRLPTLPTVVDDKLERFVADEAAKILKVSENARKAGLYRFLLVSFPRKDILGLSVGNHQIFVSFELSRLAYDKENYRWLLRQTLAHEIAHDVLGRPAAGHGRVSSPEQGLANSITANELGLIGNASFSHYSRLSELEADRKGMEYWKRVGWDCAIWIRIFQNFLDQGYQGDVDHPTQERLSQAGAACQPGRLRNGNSTLAN